VWGKGVSLGVSYALTTSGRGPSATQFLGFSYIDAHTLWRRTTKFDVVTVTYGKETCYRRSATPHPKGCGVPALLMLGFLYDQIRNGNTYEEGCVLGQPPHCICTNASLGLSAIAVYCANVLYVSTGGAVSVALWSS